MRVRSVRVSHEKRYNVTFAPEQARFRACSPTPEAEDMLRIVVIPVFRRAKPRNDKGSGNQECLSPCSAQNGRY